MHSTGAAWLVTGLFYKRSNSTTRLLRIFCGIEVLRFCSTYQHVRQSRKSPTLLAPLNPAIFLQRKPARIGAGISPLTDVGRQRRCNHRLSASQLTKTTRYWGHTAWPGIGFNARMCRAEMTAASIQEILVGLASGDANSAWNQFLSDYSPLILHLARRYENDDGRVMDCYVFVCEKLSDDGFGRLLKFRPDEPAKFRAWLTAVVGNLCIDWRRKEYGRPRPLRAIARLPELDRLVFHNLYDAGMTRLDCLNALSSQFTDLTEERIAEINSRIHSLLSSRQRWQLLARKRTTISLSEPASKGHTSAQPTEPGPQIGLSLRPNRT